MKKSPAVVVLFLILSVFSCVKKDAKEIKDSSGNIADLPAVENISADEKAQKQKWGKNKNINTADIKINEFIDIFQLYINNGAILSDQLRYFETVLEKETPMYKIDNDQTSLIEILPPNTGITILAQNNSRDKRSYLIRVKDDIKLWSGWIQNEYVDKAVNEEIDNVHYRERFLKTLREGVSTRDNLFATQTGHMGEFIVVKDNGEIIFTLTQEKILETVKEAGGGGIIGWSKDNTKIWFECYMDAYLACIGIIDINNGNYTILERPPQIGTGSGEFKIDFENYKIYYTDYAFQFDTDTARSTKASGKIFHLYSYDFTTKEQQLIDTNKGEGFSMFYDNTDGFRYEKNDDY